ncbi:unnamed protein product [Parascedosporium putredinis]|uniref:Uncharacterized protein n=1 Tax=Parascedosporium putredinis TaxID=1442378 RepID=A0A9P1HAW2_9PEZI|nr:unnamed protein product [Parascedosporium putredinis]CAI8002495.1 unnamed protein product [Parascedosporium putredinis]
MKFLSQSKATSASRSPNASSRGAKYDTESIMTFDSSSTAAPKKKTKSPYDSKSNMYAKYLQNSMKQWS